MKALFLATQPMVIGSGISHKIKTQYEAFVNNGIDMVFCHQKLEADGSMSYYIGDEFLCSMGKGFKAHLALYYKYNEIYRYIANNQIEFVFIRYIQLANPFYNDFLRKLNKHGVKIYIEIPTYPYDGEYTIGLVKKLQKGIEKMYRNRLRKYVDRIVTYSLDKEIFGIPTIHISNGIDMAGTSLRKPIEHNAFNLIGVAMIKKWHGFDRIIEGMKNYYKNGGKKDVHFYIIGNGDESLEEYKTLVNRYHLCDKVHFEGVKKTDELDWYFDMSDLAIGCLACHRKNVTYVKSLKNIEYAARGIAFTYSEINDDFDNQEYVIKQIPDESPIDIEQLIQFTNKIKNISSRDIRNSVERKLSWNTQIGTICNTIK